ncbi:MLRP1-like protein [Mya arenaria]|uniref:MLRP1-like protein n=1 Tax=Mya arenaria TaxID=6604 RepID=A0ABY7E6K9_MYAAR|nr:MLRP1-like protein [Mya arenaria]
MACKGLCTWTNPGLIDDFDWLVGQGNTQSSLTGPASDHTLGNSSGHYVFIESSAPRSPGDRADLRSIRFDTTGPRCVNFWANMHGSNIGTLRVMVVPVNSSTGNNVTIWELGQQDKGQAWFPATAPFTSSVPHYVSSYNCLRVIVTEKLPQYNRLTSVILSKACVGGVSDMAIDDVSVGTGTCTLPGNCNFDDGTMCSWKNMRNDNFDWLIGSGKTSSAFTGPSADHTQGTVTSTSGEYW